MCVCVCVCVCVRVRVCVCVRARARARSGMVGGGGVGQGGGRLSERCLFLLIHTMQSSHDQINSEDGSRRTLITAIIKCLQDRIQMEYCSVLWQPGPVKLQLKDNIFGDNCQLRSLVSLVHSEL